MDTRTTLLAALPLLLIIVVLGAVLIFSSNPGMRFDIRPKASAPVPTYAPVNPYGNGLSPAPAQLGPEVACTDLYSPVCSEDNVTYTSTCEADKARAVIAYYSACATTSSSVPTNSLPIAQ
jgi:hypothetical protein